MNIGHFGLKSSFAVEMLDRLQAKCPNETFLAWSPEATPAPGELDILLAIGPVNEDVFTAQPKFGLLQMASAGYDGVDVEAATEAGIWVASAPTGKTGNGESVAEHAVLLMLAAARRLNEELAFTRAAADDRPEAPEGNRALFGKTACIVGLGGIGALLIERLRGFGMILTGVDKHPDDAPAGVKAYGEHQLTDAFCDADFVVLALPGDQGEREHVRRRRVGIDEAGRHSRECGERHAGRRSGPVGSGQERPAVCRRSGRREKGAHRRGESAARRAAHLRDTPHRRVDGPDARRDRQVSRGSVGEL